jgi:hypothetical protein
MTFRIDSLYIMPLSETEYAWRARIKGLYGYGFYVDLVTNELGRGLRIENMDVQEVRWLINQEHRAVSAVIASDDKFYLPRGIALDEAIRKLAVALLEVGWGPWIASDRSTIASSTAEATDLDRHSITQHLKNGTLLDCLSMGTLRPL